MNPGQGLAKELYAWLTEAGIRHDVLRPLGWFDFLNGQVPETDDARTVGAHAADLLLFDSGGAPLNYEPRILYAILAFVQARRGGGNPTELEKSFNEMKAEGVISIDRLLAWFEEEYP